MVRIELDNIICTHIDRVGEEKVILLPSSKGQIQPMRHSVQTHLNVQEMHY